LQPRLYWIMPKRDHLPLSP